MVGCASPNAFSALLRSLLALAQVPGPTLNWPFADGMVCNSVTPQESTLMVLRPQRHAWKLQLQAEHIVSPLGAWQLLVLPCSLPLAP